MKKTSMAILLLIVTFYLVRCSSDEAGGQGPQTGDAPSDTFIYSVSTKEGHLILDGKLNTFSRCNVFKQGENSILAVAAKSDDISVVIFSWVLPPSDPSRFKVGLVDNGVEVSVSQRSKFMVIGGKSMKGSPGTHDLCSGEITSDDKGVKGKVRCTGVAFFDLTVETPPPVVVNPIQNWGIIDASFNCSLIFDLKAPSSPQ